MQNLITKTAQDESRATLSIPSRRGTKAVTTTVASLAAAITLGGIVGCASAPPPTAQMAVAEASVQRASNASTNENAAASLQIAVTKLASARTAMNNKD
jgi:hypothetical protein